MGGSIGKAVGNITKSPTRVFTAIGTGGTSEIYRHTVPGANQLGGMVDRTGDKLMGWGNPDAALLPSAPGGQSPTDLLASTGGAPVLAQIAMGVSPKAALAGFMGIPEDQYEEWLGTLNPKDVNALNSVSNQLKSIQQNTELRNKAVQSVIADFPNVTAQIAKDRAASGQEFDQVTQGYMKQALDQTAAKYAAGGGLSSGAANEAFAKTGANMGLQKLDYMGNREAVSQQQNFAGFNARLGEVNALRDFQNTMLQQKASEGFSANQANLGRIQQSGMANADYANQRYVADQNSKNAMFGALGSLGGTIIGGAMFGPGGAGVGNQLGGGLGNTNEQSGSFNSRAPKFYTTSYGRTMGGGY